MDIHVFTEDNPYTETISAHLREHNALLGHTSEATLLTLVALNGEQFLGGITALAKWNYIYVDNLYVVEKRKGIGRALMLEVERLAQDMGKRGVYLFTGAFQTPAFYESLGYKESGRVPGLVGPHDEILYVKELV